MRWRLIVIAIYWASACRGGAWGKGNKLDSIRVNAPLVEEGICFEIPIATFVIGNAIITAAGFSNAAHAIIAFTSFFIAFTIEAKVFGFR